MATIQEIKNRVLSVSIVEVVGKFVRLKKQAGEYVGRCPFHQEKTPSFSVNPKKGIFKCFGCGESGDSIAFIMKHEKKGFMEALQMIANIANIPFNYEREERGHDIKKPSNNFKTVDKALLVQSLAHYELNPFFQFISSLIGPDAALEKMMEFFVGTAKGGGTVFWLIDQFGRPRTAQKIFYKGNGHRDKNKPPKRVFTTFQGYEPCFFGEHQLLKAGKDDLIAIVESEKTALIASIYLPMLNGQKVYWLAASGNNGITDSKAWVLRGLNVCLVPDFSYTSRATWGILPMKKKVVMEGGREKSVIAEDGEVDEEYFSRAALLQKLGCKVSFFDPYPEIKDNSDIADLLIQLEAPKQIAIPDFDELTLPEEPFS